MDTLENTVIPATLEKVDFFSLDRTELESLLAEEFGESKYRASQLFQWVYQKGVRNPQLMTNINKEFREKIAERFSFAPIDIQDLQYSNDGTRKYLFRVAGGDLIESVMIKQPKRMTLCVSSQVGCALGCKFCRTGTMGLKRHLNTSEIVRQVVGVVDDAKRHNDMFTNIVFMGMGEPLHNFDNVTRALRILGDDFGLSISARRITVSTVGLVPAIKKFFESGIEANLAVSLNATTDEVRDVVMPINKRFKIAELLDTLRSVPMKPRKRITIEYVMLHNVNDREEDLRRLPKLLHDMPVKINLIPYNTNADLGFEAPPKDKPLHWQKELNRQGFVATIRWSKGQDIKAACGQLVTESSRKSKLPEHPSLAVYKAEEIGLA